MKSIAEILKSKGITEATKFHNYEYLYEMMKLSCEEFSRQFHKPNVIGSWVACSEKFPAHRKSVFVMDRLKQYDVGHYDGAEWRTETPMSNNGIICWMEIPPHNYL